MVLPESFTLYTQELMGQELFSDFLSAFETETPTSIRINRAKWDGEPVGGRQVAWCKDGYYLDRRPNFTFDPLLHAGCYYVQEASSMFVSHALQSYTDPHRPLSVLDMCAAPGGKSTAVLSQLPPGSVMICNEPVRQRAQILTENLHKWGLPNTLVTNNYPDDFLKTGLTFDVIVCDVPCSGEGMFRKDEGAVGEWSVQNVEKCSQLQRSIVRTAWQLLKPGGLMVYSTCTFNTKEDEENVAWCCAQLGAEPLPVSTRTDWHITGSLLKGFPCPVYRFIPGRTTGEGIFMAVLQKPEDGDGCDKTGKKKKKCRRNDRPSAPPSCGEWLREKEKFVFDTQGDYVWAIPSDAAPLYYGAKGELRLLKAGITMGQTKGKDLIPHQSLALSTALNPDAFTKAELTYSQAIAYLRKEPVNLPQDTPKGYVLLTFRNKPLGFVKNLGNRSNNLYPQEWKIKSSHVPEENRVI